MKSSIRLAMLIFLLILALGCVSKMDELGNKGRDVYGNYIDYIKNYNRDVSELNSFADRWGNLTKSSDEDKIIRAAEEYVKLYGNVARRIISFRNFIRENSETLERWGIKTEDLLKSLDELEFLLKLNLKNIKKDVEERIKSENKTRVIEEIDEIMGG